MELYRGGNLKDVAAAQGLAEQKRANFLKNRIFLGNLEKWEIVFAKVSPG